MSLAFIGIDCGLDGAVAVIEGVEVRFFDTPTGKGTKRLYLEDEMAALLRPYAARAYALVEAVSGRPGQGTASARSIGLGYGIWIGILAALEIAREPVQPAVWKRQFGLLGADKNASRGKAQALFPQVNGQLNLVKHHGRAEALLLAETARRRHEGKR